MKVNIYVDGFNLYYGAVKGTPYRWLNIAEMCRLLLPHDEILQIKYFTAEVNPRPTDPDQRSRQETFLRALATIPNLSIIYGFFLTHEIMMPLAPPGKGYVRVIKTEEKGSDVNIATHLLTDAFDDAYELAVIVSNDSDLLAPIKVVTQRLRKPVGILNPHKVPSTALLPHAKIRQADSAWCPGQQPVSKLANRRPWKLLQALDLVSARTRDEICCGFVSKNRDWLQLILVRRKRHD